MDISYALARVLAAYRADVAKVVNGYVYILRDGKWLFIGGLDEV